MHHAQTRIARITTEEAAKGDGADPFLVKEFSVQNDPGPFAGFVPQESDLFAGADHLQCQRKSILPTNSLERTHQQRQLIALAKPADKKDALLEAGFLLRPNGKVVGL